LPLALTMRNFQSGQALRLDCVRLSDASGVGLLRRLDYVITA
jgi:hypothetical protein